MSNMTKNQKIGYAFLTGGAMCCVTVIGAPIGVILIVVGLLFMFMD